MTEMALRSRIAVLVVMVLLSVAGAFGTSAFVTTHDAQAGPILGSNTPTPLPAGCVKIASPPYIKCY